MMVLRSVLRKTGLPACAGLALRLLRHCRGSTAIEFAIAGPIFLLFCCMIVENGVVLFSQAALDSATRDAARLIMTGQITSTSSQSTFTTPICNAIKPLIPCTGLQVNVVSAAAFSSLSTTVSTNSAGNLSSTQFSPGTSGQDVVVQVAYNRPYLIPWVGKMVGSNSSLLLISTAAFQNEPY